MEELRLQEIWIEGQTDRQIVSFKPTKTLLAGVYNKVRL